MAFFCICQGSCPFVPFPPFLCRANRMPSPCRVGRRLLFFFASLGKGIFHLPLCEGKAGFSLPREKNAFPLSRREEADFYSPRWGKAFSLFRCVKGSEFSLPCEKNVSPCRAGRRLLFLCLVGESVKVRSHSSISAAPPLLAAGRLKRGFRSALAAAGFLQLCVLSAPLFFFRAVQTLSALFLFYDILVRTGKALQDAVPAKRYASARTIACII